MPPDPRRRFRWNRAAARYTAPNGQFISHRQLQQALDVAIAGEQRAMGALFKGLQSGALPLDSFVLGMRQSVKLVHLWSAALAKGGWAQLTPSDYGVVGQTLRFHYARLQRFALQLAAGLPMDGRARVRVEMYAQSARKTYHDIQFRAIASTTSYTEMRNVLDPAAESCAECLGLDGVGWQPLGAIPLPGTRLCLTGCRCRLEYR